MPVSSNQCTGSRYHRIISNSGVYENELNTFTLGFYPEVHYVSVVTDNDTLRTLSNQLSIPSVGPSHAERLECDSEPEDPTESESTPSEESNTTDVHPIDSDQDEREEINTFYEVDQEKFTNKPKLILHRVSRVEERAFNRGNTCPVESRCGDSLNCGTFANEPGDLTSDNTNLIDIEGRSKDPIENIRYKNTVDVNNRDVDCASSDNNTDTTECVGPDAGRLFLPDDVLRMIIVATVQRYPTMRYTLQRVSPFFAHVVRSIGFPSIYIRPSQVGNLPRVVSVARISRMYGNHSGLMFRVRNILGDAGSRWFRAWLTLEYIGQDWYEVRDISWR